MKSNPWIRAHRTSLHNPKIVSLTDRQHRAWFNCLLMSDDAGNLPIMRDIAVHMRMTIPDAEQLICELIEARLIDPARGQGGQFAYQMHDWADHQYQSDSSTERSRKHREKKKETSRNGNATLQQRSSDASATPPEPDPERKEDTKPTSLESDAARASEVKEATLSSLGRVGKVSPEARRKACAKLNVADAAPLVRLFDGWALSASARDVDALFLGSVEKFYREATPEVRAACKPIVDEPILLRPAAQASSALRAKLAGERRHGH